MNTLQALTLVGVGILIESKEKRTKFFGLINQVGKTTENTIKGLTKDNINNKSIEVNKENVSIQETSTHIQ